MVSRYVVGGFGLACIVVCPLGFLYLTQGLYFGTQGLRFVRALQVAVGVGVFAITLIFALAFIDNVLLRVAVVGISTVVGLFVPKTIGRHLPERQLQLIGIILIVLGIGTTLVPPLLDVLKVPVH